MAIEKTKDGTLVTTTDIHLARGIGDALHHAYRGELEFHYNPEQNRGASTGAANAIPVARYLRRPYARARSLFVTTIKPTAFHGQPLSLSALSSPSAP
jgi:hypothetical protein